MALALLVVSCLFVLVQESDAAPGPLAARIEDFARVQYRYGYDMADCLNGEYKSQQEQRQGDVVQGSYSLVKPDSTRRLVDYAANSINGFNAVVRKKPLVATTPVAAAPGPASPQPALVAARYTYGFLAPIVYRARYAASEAPVYGTWKANAYSPFGRTAAAYASSDDTRRSIRFALGAVLRSAPANIITSVVADCL